MKPAFVSDDGRVFDTEEECRDYERFLEQKHDILKKEILTAVGRGDNFRDCPTIGHVTELILALVDVIKTRNIRMTKPKIKTNGECEYEKSDELRELLFYSLEFMLSLYVESFLELKSQDDANHFAEGFFDWFSRIEQDCRSGRERSWSISLGYL